MHNASGMFWLSVSLLKEYSAELLPSQPFYLSLSLPFSPFRFFRFSKISPLFLFSSSEPFCRIRVLRWGIFGKCPASEARPQPLFWILLLFYCFCGRVSLCSPGYPQTLTSHPIPSTAHVLQLRVFDMMIGNVFPLLLLVFSFGIIHLLSCLCFYLYVCACVSIHRPQCLYVRGQFLGVSSLLPPGAWVLGGQTHVNRFSKTNTFNMSHMNCPLLFLNIFFYYHSTVWHSRNKTWWCRVVRPSLRAESRGTTRGWLPRLHNTTSSLTATQLSLRHWMTISLLNNKYRLHKCILTKS